MNLRDFPLFADENILSGMVEFLRSEGFDVKWVREEGCIGWKDADLMLLAYSENRVIITQDSDFGELVFTQNADYVGIVYLRPGHFPSEKHIQTLHALLSEELDLRPPFLITAVNNGNSIKIRLRQ